MLTRIVETSKGYKVGDSFTLDNRTYTIAEIQVSGDLSRLYLK